ncbi:MAG: LacI family DNA-binding transcriptional regulator [Gaiellaceae bacterium]|jgi:LacI family transcriptional regulator
MEKLVKLDFSLGSARRATIRDVAARAGVSHQTVSRVINESTSVSASTRERVLAAIEELDYVPSSIARGFSRNRTHSLGIVTDDISDFSFGHIAAGAEAEARRRGYFLIIASVESDADESSYLRLMLERRVEGFILARPSVPFIGEHLDAVRRAGVPLVLVGTSHVPGVAIVESDNRRGGYHATRHLLELEHRQIATIVGPTGWPAAVERLEGYREALGEFGISPDAGLEETADDWGIEGGQTAAGRLLARRRKFTALFAHSDLIALGAIARLREEGLRVPDDVSVVGFDDLPVAVVVNPPLTTIHQPAWEKGTFAAGLLLDHVTGVRALRTRAHVLPCELVRRSSTQPLR